MRSSGPPFTTKHSMMSLPLLALKTTGSTRSETEPLGVLEVVGAAAIEVVVALAALQVVVAAPPAACSSPMSPTCRRCCRCRRDVRCRCQR